jgi:hypothetical protein
MSDLKQLDAAEFRRRLAGLSDAAGGEDLIPDEYRELAAEYVLLLAICFNRDRLDAVTLWSRIDSAIERGLAECDGEDIERFVSVGLEHVLASVNVAASNERALEIQDRLFSLRDHQRVFFLRYLADHRYPAIVFGRGKWQAYQQERKEVTA